MDVAAGGPPSAWTGARFGHEPMRLLNREERMLGYSIAKVRPGTLRGIFWGYTAYSALWLVLGGIGTWAIVKLAYDRTGDKTFFGRRGSAIEVLRQRYARGEVDATTFAEMRTQLESSRVRESALDGVTPNSTAAYALR
jgi:hypothetical protein